MNLHPRPDAMRPAHRYGVPVLLLGLCLSGLLGLGEGIATNRAAAADPNAQERAQLQQEAQQAQPHLNADLMAMLENTANPELALAQNHNPFFTATPTILIPARPVSARPPAVKVSAPPPPSIALASTGQVIPVEPQPPTLAARYAEWRAQTNTARASRQEAPPRSQVYLVQELAPIGTTTIGNAQEVWFRLDAEKRAFAAPLNTNFYDATLVALGQEGPRFRMKKDGSCKTVTWAQNSNDTGDLSSRVAPELPTGADNTAQLVSSAPLAGSNAANPKPDNGEHSLAHAPRPSAEVAVTPTPTPPEPPVASPLVTDARNAVKEEQSPPAPASVALVPLPPSPLCRANFAAERISIDFTTPAPLGNFVDKLNQQFGANIVVDAELQDLPLRLTLKEAPWTQVLQLVMGLNDLDLLCLDGGLAGLARRNKIAQMEDQKRKNAPLVTRYYKLNNLIVAPPAGRSINLLSNQGGGRTVAQNLEEAIRSILRAAGDPRGEVRVTPGRNELMVAATAEAQTRIAELIARADQAPKMVEVQTLIYTVSNSQLRDVGSQLSAVVGNAGHTRVGGGVSQSTARNGNGNNNTSGTATASATPGGLQPGGVPGLGTGFALPNNNLQASNPLAVLGFTSIFGTSQFAYQLTLAQQQGLVNIQSRAFGYVTDGQTFDLVRGTQIPVVTSAIAGGASLPTGDVQFIEASLINRITPVVAEQEDGSDYITLYVSIENNSVDTSLGLFGGVPAINRQALNVPLRVKSGETVIIGGLTGDLVSRGKSKVPGLGDVPGLGHLFRRKTQQESRDRLYFAISVRSVAGADKLAFPAPGDAQTTPPPPPASQNPSPFPKNATPATRQP